MSPGKIIPEKNGGKLYHRQRSGDGLEENVFRDIG